MKIIIISPDEPVKHEIETVNDLFRNGLQRYHLRKPEFDTSDYRKYIKAIEPQYHNRLVLTGSYELYNEFDLGGIHLNSNARRDDALRKKLAHLPARVLSTSYHTWQKIQENDVQYGYVFISPVFDSISKKEYKANIDPYGAAKIRKKMAEQKKYCPEIYGLGGVGVLEIQALHEYGFDGGAMLGSLWMSGNPVATFQRALNLANSLSGERV